MLGGFNPFGDNVQVQALAQADDAADQPGIVVVAAHLADKRLVDLQHIDGEFLQIAEARIPGAEVIDGQAHTQLLDRLQGDDRGVDVAHQHAFGDFQFE
ncbi:hypothetical protein D3C85_1504170 [compost metagenome]